MPRKKPMGDENRKSEDVIVETPDAEVTPDNLIPDNLVAEVVHNLVVEPVSVSTPAISDKLVRVRNQGAPFLCDLTAYGYGHKWPTDAVYNIPTSKYVELLKEGLDGVNT